MKESVEQRGDELCLACKKEWREHDAEELRCPTFSFKPQTNSRVFVPSGRVAPVRQPMVERVIQAPFMPNIPQCNHPDPHRKRANA